MITSQDIISWADRKACETQLPILVRRLVNETGERIEACDFPGGDGAQIGGWDGVSVVGVGNAWVPTGRAGWEMGKQKDIKGKADEDYGKRLAVPEAERLATTFVFVTPRRWRGHTSRTGQEAWLLGRRAAGEWKAVRVIDADALEQWLEQAPATRKWFGDVLGKPGPGLLTPDAAWQRWAAPATPTLTPAVFDEPIARARDRLDQFFSTPQTAPLIIAADRRDEALAMVAAVLSHDDFRRLADGCLIATDSAALSSLASAPPPLVIVASRDAEAAIGAMPQKTRVIVVTARSELADDAGIVVDPLSPDAFRKVIEIFAQDHHQGSRLARESGKSITILRRRLTPLDRRPAWASDTAFASRLIPFALAGSWVTSEASGADDTLLAALAAETPETLERDFRLFAEIDDPPVFAVGRVRAVSSRIDAFDAVRPWITRADLDRFFEAYAAILEDPDPSLDLAEDVRWLAGIYGKTRLLSGRLRRGLLETAILLDINATELRRTTGVDVSARIAQQIRTALPLGSPDRWLDLRDALRSVAEASPETFLDILERDLDQAEPGVLALIKPVAAPFGAENLRTELMWALELLAWNPAFLARVAAVLARLSHIELKDNHVNKPAHSLASLFRFWLPQTAAGIERRIAVMTSLCRRDPAVMWPIVVAQLRATQSIAFPGSRPRWREDAAAAERPGPEQQDRMSAAAMALALGWPVHTASTLADLIEGSPWFGAEDQSRIWDLIERWAPGETETSRAELGERLRQHLLSVRSMRRLRPDDLERAKAVFEMLRPRDGVLRHAYLFAKEWIQLTADEAGPTDSRKDLDARTAAMRAEAVKAILDEQGGDGIARLIAGAGGLRAIGGSLATAEGASERMIALAERLLGPGSAAPASKVDAVLSAFLGALAETDRTGALDRLLTPPCADPARRLRLVSPDEDLRIRLGALSEAEQRSYWRGVQSWLSVMTPDLRRWFVEGLLAADRPRTAFQVVHLDLAELETDLVIRLLKSVYAVDRETDAGALPDSSDISEAFARLDAEPTIDRGELAQLEFIHLSALTDSSERGPTALNQLMSSSPEEFMNMVSMVYKKDDGETDQPDDPANTPVVELAYTLLEKLNVLPGTDDAGTFSPTRFEDFISDVRTRAETGGRTDVVETLLGGWMARAAPYAPHNWPPEAICRVLDEASADTLRRSYASELRNARGMTTRDYYGGGGLERTEAAKFREVAHRLADDWARTARLFERLAAYYEADAAGNDENATLRKRTEF